MAENPPWGVWPVSRTQLGLVMVMVVKVAMVVMVIDLDQVAWEAVAVEQVWV